MTFRTIGIDLAIRGDHLAQIYDDGRPNGRAIRFRHDADFSHLRQFRVIL
ncbi:hypothetical protein [Acetobacter pasteurianus]|uniref:Uncharacterized protein n=1 Tax=Acetobacter pasteurianus subsp. pasteurianus TaxID=481145 RepID=A0A1Y0Y4Z2_ACEPA|nr:hypothetical protein [Acetobacter pasteurianus]ARW49452.1 hypothetical protein S1001342_03162 [Acetobacter pasteurianus subsp. pasteurianus]